MKLFLVRHGQAMTGAPSDPTRSLTNIGQQQAEKAALWLAAELKEASGPIKIFSSPYLRAWQTAEQISLSLKQDIELMTALQPDAEPRDILNSLTCQGGNCHMILVTHLPLVGRLASLLIDGEVFEQPWSLAEVWELEGDIAAAGCMENTGVWYPVLEEG